MHLFAFLNTKLASECTGQTGSHVVITKKLVSQM